MQSGEIVLLKELQHDRHVIGKYLRVTGSVTMLDFARRVCQIEHTDHVVWVDLTLIDLAALGLKEASLVQFIGEIRNADERSTPIGPTDNGRIPFYLQAKVARVVDGLDMTLYEQALMSRRDFLKRGDQKR